MKSMSLHSTGEANNNHSLEYSTICIIPKSKLQINFQQKKQSPSGFQQKKLGSGTML